MRGGKREGAGRKPSIKTQLKRFEEKHPGAYDQLMEVLFSSGLDGHSLDAQYVIDRIKGKPKAITGMDAEDREALNAATLVKLFQMMDEHRKLEQPPPRPLNYGGSQEDAAD